jgi:hypothetical protein
MGVPSLPNQPWRRGTDWGWMSAHSLAVKRRVRGPEIGGDEQCRGVGDLGDVAFRHERLVGNARCRQRFSALGPGFGDGVGEDPFLKPRFLEQTGQADGQNDHRKQESADGQDGENDQPLPGRDASMEDGRFRAWDGGGLAGGCKPALS